MFAPIARLAAVTLVLSLPAVGMSGSKMEPLNERGVLDLVELGFDDETIVERINAGGVTFEVTDQFVEKLKSAKASAAVIKAVQEAGKAKTAAPTSAGDADPPITFDQVLKILTLRMKEDKILQRIAKTPPVFVLSAAQEEELVKAGATPKVIAALKGDRSPPALAEAISNVALVLDCSGSMKETTKEGVTKMEAAKKVVADLIEKIPKGLNVTFVIYGHEVQGGADDPRNCQAVKVVRPLGKLDDAGKGELGGLIASLKPTGGTPIALALKVTGEELAKDKESACGIVLITDGLESCKGNPTGVAAALLKTLKVSFGVNVVGLGVKEDEDAALKALATAGGGKYYNADDAAALADSFSEIAKELEVKARPADVVGASRRALKFLQPQIEMPDMKEIVLIEAEGPVKDATLFKKGAIEKYGEELRVPSATAKYDVVWYPKSGEAIRIMKGVQLAERKVVEVKVENLVGFIKVSGEGTPTSIHAGAVDDPGDLSFSTQRAKKFGEIMVVPIGDYDVFVNRSVIEEGLQVEPGKLYELE
jgi:hypothetical protein